MYTLPCCLFDPTCFVLPSFSHLSLKHVHRYQCVWPGVDLRRLLHSAASGVPRHSDLCLRPLWLQVRGHLVGGFINPRHACAGGLWHLLYVSVCLSVCCLSVCCLSAVCLLSVCLSVCCLSAVCLLSVCCLSVCLSAVCCLSVTTLAAFWFISTIKLRYERLQLSIFFIFNSWIFKKMLRSKVRVS